LAAASAGCTVALFLIACVDCKQGAALNLAGTTGAAAIAFAKARQDEGPSALLQQIQKEDSSGTILNVYERVKVLSATVVLWDLGFRAGRIAYEADV
jgi:hypothetical protein